jgi:hypothetical protein
MDEGVFPIQLLFGTAAAAALVAKAAFKHVGCGDGDKGRAHGLGHSEDEEAFMEGNVCANGFIVWVVESSLKVHTRESAFSANTRELTARLGFGEKLAQGKRGRYMYGYGSLADTSTHSTRSRLPL